MNRTTVVVAVLVMVAAGCGGGSTKDDAAPSPSSSAAVAPTAATSTTAAGSKVPAIVRAAMAGGAKLRRADPVDGHEVYVDDAQKLIYLDDCDVARRITAEGQPYGPSKRDAEGNFTPGHNFICT